MQHARKNKHLVTIEKVALCEHRLRQGVSRGAIAVELDLTREVVDAIAQRMMQLEKPTLLGGEY